MLRSMRGGGANEQAKERLWGSGLFCFFVWECRNPFFFFNREERRQLLHACCSELVYFLVLVLAFGLFVDLCWLVAHRPMVSLAPRGLTIIEEVRSSACPSGRKTA